VHPAGLGAALLLFLTQLVDLLLVMVRGPAKGSATLRAAVRFEHLLCFANRRVVLLRGTVFGIGEDTCDLDRESRGKGLLGRVKVILVYFHVQKRQVKLAVLEVGVGVGRARHVRQWRAGRGGGRRVSLMLPRRRHEISQRGTAHGRHGDSAGWLQALQAKR